MAAIDRVYETLVSDDEDHGCGDLPEESCREVPRNAARITGVLTLTRLGDRIVDPKTVLTWLLAAAGAPAFLTGLLVPVRESSSVLPQAALVPLVRRAARRKWVWAAGCAGQALAVAGMAVVAVTWTGAALGWGIVVLLAMLGVSRSLASISSKDVLAKTVPQGRRGRVTGLGASAAGVVTIGTGLTIRGVAGDADIVLFGILLALAATCWALASALAAAVDEHAAATDEGGLAMIAEALGRLRSESALRRYVTVRTLLFVTALSPPYLAVLATRRQGSDLGDLGVFVVASGLASMLGAPMWGRYADRSSRWLMAWSGWAGSAIILVVLVATRLDGPARSVWFLPTAYFAMMLAHSGTRLGRKTYVVDIARGDRRTDYVAVSNTVVGVALLAVGAATSALAAFGAEAALGLLALMGVVGGLAAPSLEDPHPDEQA